ncbi:hypothetical protein E2562_026783 [Oryza meyeriana var. granulata]|uniref:Uncharacterized protein n=1 Tax=Oryza meyeriana var. granulata TaxID=110450 RepID=A0A6G1CTD8_9ORYZ|nr:hypothetical protein E2562_026783 [Oryza meyeriana var. granulata]
MDAGTTKMVSHGYMPSPKPVRPLEGRAGTRHLPVHKAEAAAVEALAAVGHHAGGGARPGIYTFTPVLVGTAYNNSNPLSPKHRPCSPPTALSARCMSPKASSPAEDLLDDSGDGSCMARAEQVPSSEV